MPLSMTIEVSPTDFGKCLGATRLACSIHVGQHKGDCWQATAQFPRDQGFSIVSLLPERALIQDRISMTMAY
jgi:hypothetical protein